MFINCLYYTLKNIVVINNDHSEDGYKYDGWMFLVEMFRFFSDVWLLSDIPKLVLTITCSSSDEYAILYKVLGCVYPMTIRIIFLNSALCRVIMK